MAVSIKELHSCELGSREYWFRTPTAYDTPRLRRELTLQGIRRPLPIEFRVAAIAGIEALGDTAGEPEETERQKELIEEWYELLAPIGEDDIDEPDLELRAAELAARLAEREAARARIFPQVMAVEANLARHWQPYRELLADRGYWDDASAIDIVRLLLVREGNAVLARDADGMVTHEAYRAIPLTDRGPLATFASGLLSPTETQRKN
jgi:hypothetical protein